MTKYVIVKGVRSYGVMESSELEDSFPWDGFENAILVGKSKEDLVKQIQDILETVNRWEVYDG